MAEVIEIITDPVGVNDLPLMGGPGEIDGCDNRAFLKADDH